MNSKINKQKQQESRRDFLRTSGLNAGTTLISSLSAFSKTDVFIADDESTESNNSPGTPDWINYFAKTKLRLIEKRIKATGLPTQPKLIKDGEKASTFFIELHGADNLILSARRGNQEGQWGYAVWHNACFIDDGG